MIMIAIGAVFLLRSFLYEHYHQSDIPNEWFSRHQEIEAVVIDNPDKNFEKNKYTIQPYYQGHQMYSRIMVTDYSGERVAYGDRVTISGTLDHPESFTTTSGRVFEYDNYLAVHDVYATMKIYTVVIKENNQGSKIKKYLFSIRNSFQEKIVSFIKYPESGLLSGILLGQKTMLPQDLVKDFQIAGLSHVMVLSGYNITIIVMFASTLFATFGCGYRTRRWCALGMIPLFIIMTGFGASSVRAGIMAAMLLMLQITTRPNYSFRVLFITAGSMIFYNPRILLHDPSFHLSMLAFIGLLYMTPVLVNFLRQDNLIIETMAVQITVLPYLLYSTGIFSALSLLVNIVTVPLVPGIMLGGFVIITSSYLLGSAVSLVARPVVWALTYMIWVVEKTVSYTWATIQFPMIGYWVVIMVYGIMTLLLIYYHNFYVSKYVSKITNP